MLRPDSLLVLVAPNVSEQMGGEAIKALHIFQEMARVHPNTILITHERNRRELSERLRLANVFYVPDSALAILLWRSVLFRWLLNPWFSIKAVRMAEQIAAERGLSGPSVVIHQTEPNSPVMPRATSKHHPNVFGPINGNIYYPSAFRKFESKSARLRRIFHMPAARIHRLLFSAGMKRVSFILCAGGDRTRRSLLACGHSRELLVESLDCGIKDALLDRPRVTHRGANLHFIHFGRLVFHKCTFLIIESLAKTRHRILLDIVGEGPERKRCESLVQELGLDARVRFLGWYEKHEDLLDRLPHYRGVVLPSIEDANGIVVQEAMAMGLPVVSLDWGGPQLLIDDGVSGFLIDPTSIGAITTQMAEHLDRLGNDGELADSMSRAARAKAEQWRWSRLVRDWAERYPDPGKRDD
jgi:glycosyltransferase involved in cell wall biosynthesis